MQRSFNQETLPNAIRWLFETNGYSVVGPVQRNGAEIDLIATSKAGLVEQVIVIEATVQYVDNTKYGKDLTKFQMFAADPHTQCLLVSSTGFTKDVIERAAQARIMTMTYDELFKRFEKTAPYIEHILGNGSFAKQLAELDEVYEEPQFNDRHGTEQSTDYLTTWLNDSNSEARWLVVVGEYGTGKTALTRVVQRRWTKLYNSGESTRLPFRIELRDFTKQFDARGLLHHFLDRNELSHVPVGFVESLIEEGRVILLLDGYDEIAQYLNIRERRACLEALAELAGFGARGILTSRPNYFTEAEELRVFEVLYQRLSVKPAIEKVDQDVLQQEQQIDRLLGSFVVDRVERKLADLTVDQTRELVMRRLGGDQRGASVVTGILNRVFRPEHGKGVSLSGKPVIITYLLEVVEQLKQDQSAPFETQLTEWQIYDIVIEKLMIRDYQRTSNLLPSERREFLERLALEATIRHSKYLREDEFRALVVSQFSQQIARGHAEGRTDIAESLFEDLRSSATLTRAEGGKSFAWQFSHNSLREFLLVSYLVKRYLRNQSEPASIHITDSMLAFCRSLPKNEYERSLERLSSIWPTRRSVENADRMLLLLWGRMIEEAAASQAPFRTILSGVVGDGLDLSGSKFSRLDMSDSAMLTDLSDVNLADSELTEVGFSHANLRRANFANAMLDGCSFARADCSEANFEGSLIVDCDFTGAQLQDANLRGIDLDSTILDKSSGELEILTGQRLLAYLYLHGARVEEPLPYYIFSRHSEFQVCEKICRVLSNGAAHQRLGLEQRGASSRNVKLARQFIRFLLSVDYIRVHQASGNLVETTPQGLIACTQLEKSQIVDEKLEQFFLDQFKP
jgi:uncharacterized protein YjbI with pentapeptide repeats